MKSPAVVREITSFVFREDEPQNADIIFIPGGAYPEIAEHAAHLFSMGFAPILLPSGKHSITNGHFLGARGPLAEKYPGPYQTEWDFLSDVLKQNGVNETAILKEDQATYTYQNAIFSREVTDRAGIQVKKAILCCQAFHARRCLSYYQLLFPDTDFLVCPSITRNISRDNWYQTPEGVDLVMSELSKCGDQLKPSLISFLFS